MTTRMPISVGSRKGLSSVVAASQQGRVVLTSHGSVVGVVDSAERIDEDLRLLREAAQSVAEYATREASKNVEKRWSLDDVCARLGIDPDEVRHRASDSAQ